MSEFPGVHRKGPDRGWRFRYSEFDQTQGKVVQRTSKEYSSARKAASERSSKLREIKAASTAARSPTREGITIEGAWLSHPSTIREPEERRAKYKTMLKAFTDHIGYIELRKLTFTDVAAWIENLKAPKLKYPNGFAWSTRFHYLMPLRRAARMAVTVGLPDVLAELQIDDREEEEQSVQAWTLAELAAGWHALADNRRARVALSLGAFVGLRPSEIYRMRCGDLRPDGRLGIGLRLDPDEPLRQVKNKPSRRLLPLPPVIIAEIRDLIALRPPGAALIATAKGKASGPFNDITMVEWLGPVLERATGRALPPKHLRKSFASWTIAAGVDFWHVEAYMGRETPLTKSITGRHYLADFYQVISQQLDPTALRLNDLITAAIASAAPNGAANGAAPDLGHVSGHTPVSQAVSNTGQNATN